MREILAAQEHYYMWALYLITLLYIIGTYLSARSMEKGLIGTTTLNDTIRKTILNNWHKLPIKWFDWLKWVFLIGVLSIMEQKNSSILLQSAILISYIAIAADIYYEIYDIFVLFLFTNLDKSLGIAYRTLDDIDKEKESDKLGLDAHVLALEIDPANRQTKYKNTIINALEVFEKYQDIRSRAMRARKKMDQIRIRTKINGAIIAILWTYTLYDLLNYIVDLYVFQKIGT